MFSGKTVSFQIVDGVDKGRTFLSLPIPITIGREEGNAIRLNDDRVSRFHAKVQEDQGQLVLTDLDSTNGTRVNGETVQLRILRPGDRINVGRSTLLYGTLAEIKALLKKMEDSGPPDEEDPELITLKTNADEHDDFELSEEESVDVFTMDPPFLPARLSPAQAAQLSEIIDFLHRGLADAIDEIPVSPGATEAKIPISKWQRLQALLAILSQYSRSITEPGGNQES